MSTVGIVLTMFWMSVLSNCKISIFKHCPLGQIFVSQSTSKNMVSARSSRECTALCGQRDNCWAVNICWKDRNEETTCELLEGSSPDQCDALSSAPVGLSRCFYSKKIYPEKLRCFNNGTSNGTHCSCPIQYAGRTCERLIRDCTEPFELGFTSTYNGAYKIQPIGVQVPFWVRCFFNYGGVTYGLYRKIYGRSFNVSFQDAKSGFGDDLSKNPQSANFFIGLEKMHDILQQASYTCGVYLMDLELKQVGSVDYYNFTIGPESTQYALSYQKWEMSNIENGFGYDQPRLFSAVGFEGAENCSTIRGSPGWYGPNCQGYSPFAEQMMWPVDGTDKQMGLMNLNLIRKSAFHDLL